MRREQKDRRDEPWELSDELHQTGQWLNPRHAGVPGRGY